LTIGFYCAYNSPTWLFEIVPRLLVARNGLAVQMLEEVNPSSRLIAASKRLTLWRSIKKEASRTIKYDFFYLGIGFPAGHRPARGC
jgi:hypothetical protein